MTGAAASRTQCGLLSYIVTGATGGSGVDRSKFDVCRIRLLWERWNLCQSAGKRNEKKMRTTGGTIQK
eukprot:5423607-Prymnesium_polylepis.1